MFLKSELKESPTHLSKQALSSKEGVRWECSQCGWESAPMYFGEVFEPAHLCLNDSCKCGHCRSEHEHEFCTGARILGAGESTGNAQELCSCKSFDPR